MINNFTISPIAVAIQLAKGIFKSGAAVVQSDSLIGSTRATRIEPLVALDSTLQTQPWTTDILQSLTSLFSAYYLQAAAIHTQIVGIDVLKKLDRLNPERNVGQAMGLRFSTEDYALGLPTYGDSDPTYNPTTGLEALNLPPAVLQNASKAAGAIVDGVFHEVNEGGAGGSSNVVAGRQMTGQAITRAENLMVGKMLEVTFASDDGKHTVVVPVTIKMVPVMVSPSALAQSFSEAGLKNTAKERWHRFRAGELSFWGDLVLCNDLVDKHRSTSMQDKSGFYREVSKRNNKNSAAAVVSGQASLSDASNILVISTRTAALMEAELMGKLSGVNTRNALFAQGSLMLIVVVDPEWERVTIYHRGINLPTELKMSDLKAANKGNGVDIAEILKAYQLGKTPSF